VVAAEVRYQLSGSKRAKPKFCIKSIDLKTLNNVELKELIQVKISHTSPDLERFG
jgi:hypothetical protein